MFKKWLLIFTISLPAWGYNLTPDFLNGFYWAQFPVSFIISESDPGRKAQLTDLAQDAIGEWERDTGLSIWSLTGSGAANLIRWSTNFAAETRMDATSVLAVAIRYTNGPYFAKTEIIINGNHNSFNTGNPGINKMNLGTTLVHELGHTIGLDHSNNMMAVMAPTLQYPYGGLHNDDLYGMADAHAKTQHRQVTGYISPLSYSGETQSKQPLSCGTTGTSSTATAGNGFLSLVLGMLSGFVGKIGAWFKSRS